MPEMTQRIKILIASPKDVNKERDIAVKVISSWNAIHRDVLLEAVLWESHAYPGGTGGNPQDNLDEQLGLCDFVIGIFWHRIGTPTGVALGGAVSEIQRHEQRGRKALVYFSECYVSPNALDLDQLSQLRAYRAEREKKILCWAYKSHHEFKDHLTRHLGLLLSKFSESSSRFAVESDETRRMEKNLQDEKSYRDMLFQKLSLISLLGSPVIQHFTLKLSDIFVPLRMCDDMPSNGELEKGMEGMEGKREDAEAVHLPDHVIKEAFRKSKTLLVIGDPGSGKTTLIKYYGLTCLEPEIPTQLGFHEPLKLFYLPLRDLEPGQNGYESLPSNLAAWSTQNNLTLDKQVFQEWLDNHLSLVLLDGLDEVSEPSNRKKICKWIENLNVQFKKARFVVTARKTGYRPDQGIVFDFEHKRVNIMDFTFDQQRHFLNNWYKAAFLNEIRPAEYSEERWNNEQLKNAERLKDSMVLYLQKSENKGIRELAAVPMLLQIMAILWKERKFLPGKRQELYSAALDYLLDYRDRARNLKPPQLCADDARRVLAPVALWMQETLKSDKSDQRMMQLKMQEKLEILNNQYTAKDFCYNLVSRAGVLMEQGRNDYIFRHNTFREYLAAVQLKEEWYEEGRIRALSQYFSDKSNWWDEVLKFFIAQSNEKIFDLFMKALFSSPINKEFSQKQNSLLLALIEEAPEKKVDALCEALCRKQDDTSHFSQRFILVCLKAIGLPKALKSLHDFKNKKLALTPAVSILADDVMFNLETKIGKGTLSVNLERVFSQGILSSFRNRLEHNAHYIRVPGGSYIFSQTKSQVRIPELYFAKYPVTNRQYRTFIAYLRSELPEYESVLPLQRFFDALYSLAENNEDSLSKLRDYLKNEKNLADRFRSSRADDRKFNRDDQPVIGVSWYDANAYCLWLSMLEGELLRYRLPEEWEWEWAAGGQRKKQEDVLKVLRYPWGEHDPTAKKANFGNHEGEPIQVGSYPEGATPEGLHDMSGNVREIVGSWRDYNGSPHVLRGGSWVDSSSDLTCIARRYIFPGSVYGVFGFRVVSESPPLKSIEASLFESKDY